MNRSIMFIMFDVRRFDVRRRRRYFGGSSGGSASPAVAAPHLPTNTASAASARPPSEGRARPRRGGGFENVVEDPPTSPLNLAGVWSNTLRRKCYVAPEVRLYSKAFGTDYAGEMLLDCLA